MLIKSRDDVIRISMMMSLFMREGSLLLTLYLSG